MYRNQWKQSLRTLPKKITALILSGVMLAVLPIAGWNGRDTVTTASADTYWAQPYLQEMLDDNIMTGDSTGNLNPSDNITRAEFAAMINRALGFTKTADKVPFSDVKPVDWYYKDLSIGYNEGYFQGVSTNTASPNSPISREAAVTMLGRALRMEPNAQLQSNFTDNQKISNWSRDYVNLATSKGIISGYKDGSFGPGNTITRAEVAKLIAGLTGNIIRDDSQVRLDYVDGNVTLTQSGGGLKNTTISGDLYITDGIGSGNILLDNVKVLGQVIISGAGEANSGSCSVVFRDCEINELITNVENGGKLSLSSQGNTIISNSKIKSTAFVESDNDTGAAFLSVEVDVPEEERVDLSGTFKTVVLKSPSSTLGVQKGFVESLTVDEDATDAIVELAEKTDTAALFCDGPTLVTGKGTIGEACISTNDTEIEQLPDKVTIRPGCTAVVNGTEMNSIQGEVVNVAPEIIEKYPKVTEEDTTSAKATFKVNKAGKLYWVVIPEAFDAPTAAQMINPKLLGSVKSSGNQNIAENTEVTIKLTGLTAGTDYVVYGMLVDMHDEKSGIKMASFSTVDNTSPKFSYSELTVVTTLSSSGAADSYGVSVIATVTKDAYVYYMVLKNGSTTPSAVELISQKNDVPAKGQMPFTKNNPEYITVTGLDEATKYNFYMIAVDKSGYQSSVWSKAFETEDTTAPSMLSLYYTPGDDYFKVTFRPDEDCKKVYWALYDKNSPTVAKIEMDPVKPGPDEDLMWYETETAKKAVIQVGDAVQSDSSKTAKAYQDNTFTVSKLEKERYYRMYIVLEDAAGNQSVVYTLSPTTIDNSPPTVELIPYPTDGENLYVGTADSPSTLSISFSEVVIGRKGTTIQELASYEKSDYGLGTFIQFYRGSDATTIDTSKRVPVNWTKVTAISSSVDQDVAHTVINFTVSDSTETALQLYSGEAYTIVFTYNAGSAIYLADKSGNVLRQSPSTESAKGTSYTSYTKTFQCVEPSVSITTPAGVSSTISLPGDENVHYLDLSYRVEPKEVNKTSSADNKYDYYLNTDKDVQVNIFCLTDSDNDGTLEWEMTAENVNIYSIGSMETRPGSSIAKTVIASTTGSQTVSASDFTEKFNALGSTTGGDEVIAFEIVKYNGSMNRKVWTGTLQAKLSCVVGVGERLARMANTSGTTSAETVTVGTATAEISMFSDAKPDVSYSLLQAGETTLQVQVTASNDVTLYWVAVPNRELSPSMLTSSELLLQYIKNPTPTDLQAGCVFNSTGTDFSQLQPSVTVSGLKQNTLYYVYFVAKNKNGTTLSDYSMITGNTSNVQAPVFYQQPVISFPNNSEISCQLMTSTTANIYWAVIRQVDYDAVLPMLRADPTVIKEPSDLFMSYRVTGSSKKLESSTTVNSYGYFETNFTITGLDQDQKYILFALAQSQNDPEVFSNYTESDVFSIPNPSYPKISSVDFAYTRPNTAAVGFTYGRIVITVRFDRLIYYQKDALRGPLDPSVVGDVISDWWSISNSDTFINSVTGEPTQVDADYHISGNTSSNDQELTFMYRYRGNHWSTIYSKFNVCNSKYASAGALMLYTNINGYKGTCTVTIGQKNHDGYDTTTVTAAGTDPGSDE